MQENMSRYHKTGHIWYKYTPYYYTRYLDFRYNKSTNSFYLQTVVGVIVIQIKLVVRSIISVDVVC